MLIINCRFLTQNITGVQRFSEEIACRLAETVEDVRLVAPKGYLRKTILGGKRVEQVGTFTGHLWEQIDLPLLLKARPGRLVCLGNTGPLVVRNQALVVHDLTWLQAPESYSLKFRIFYQLTTKVLVHRVQTLCTVSSHSKQILEAHYGLDSSRVSVVPNAVDESFGKQEDTRPANVGDEEFFLVVSSLNKHKNIAALVDAFAEYAQESGSKTKLLLVGGSSSAFSKVDGKKLGSDFEDCFQSIGRVTDNELVWLYKQAKAFVFPSLQEGFGIPPLEAQSLGCPVVASSIPALQETLEESALYFDPSCKTSMKRALAKIDSTESLRVRLIAAGMSNVNRYSWRLSAELILQAMRVNG
ncbi:glycosyltransferase family 4 protein [Corynebacterium flavescens]|uniref:glycosyltransferase family 4 protein n=1 Tax=Corynebacterium flavescens TaxID=28028 RepID=UPI003FD04BD0